MNILDTRRGFEAWLKMLGFTWLPVRGGPTAIRIRDKPISYFHSRSHRLMVHVTNRGAELRNTVKVTVRDADTEFVDIEFYPWDNPARVDTLYSTIQQIMEGLDNVPRHKSENEGT